MSTLDPQRSDASDVSLIEQTRAGDTGAYGILHDRHVGSARSLARRMSRSDADADDLVSEGFARVLSALQRGKGPDLAFRPYLLSTIRRLAYDRTTREQREAPSDDAAADVAAPTGDPVVDGFEREAAAAAFATLPERWRMVLWHTEVEGQSPAEVGQLLDMSPNAVAALAYRAREGLRQAYLTEHVPQGGSTADCSWVTGRLGAYVRGGLTPARDAKVRSHLEDCDDCQRAYLELAGVNTAMPALVAVAVLGTAGSAYLATTGAATTLSAAFAQAITPLATGGASGAGAAAVGAGTAAAGSAAGATSGSTGTGAVRAGRLAGRGRHVAAAAAVAVAVMAVAAFAASRSDDPPTEVAAPQRSTSTAAPEPEPATPPATAAPDPGPPSAIAPTGTAPTEVRGARAYRPAPTTPPAVPAPPTPTPPATTPPATTTTTTAGPTTTTTTEPPAPSTLAVDLSSAGLLVQDRPGVIVATIRNDGAGAGEDAVVTVTLEGATVRGTPTIPLGSSGASGARSFAVSGDAGAWTCSAPDPTTARCTHPSVPAGATTSVYLPVSVGSGTSPVVVKVSLTAASDTGGSGSSTVHGIPVSPAGMAARFATIDRSAIATAGNSLLTCRATDAGCAEALAGTPGAPDNGTLPLVPVDVDGDPATANSSTAALSLTPGAEVLSATLYWSAGLAAGTDGTPAADPSRRGVAVLRGPDGAAEVVAERVDDLPADQRYQAVADVTDRVRAGGAGPWTVGGVQLGTGLNTYAGWTLVVAERHPDLPLRSLVVLDGFASVDTSSAVSFSVGGFVVPSTGAGRATVDVLTYEGDTTLTGDQLAVDGTALVDAANPAGNTFNSTATVLGAPRPGRTPTPTNLLGMDLDRFDVGPALTPGATSASITFSTAADRYVTGAVAFAVDQ